MIDAASCAAANPMAVAGVGVRATCHGLVSLERRNVAPPGVHWDEIYATTTAALLRGLAGPAARCPAARPPRRHSDATRRSHMAGRRLHTANHRGADRIVRAAPDRTCRCTPTHE